MRERLPVVRVVLGPSWNKAFSVAVYRVFWSGVIVKLSKAKLFRTPVIWVSPVSTTPLLLVSSTTGRNFWGTGSDLISCPVVSENSLIKGLVTRLAPKSGLTSPSEEMKTVPLLVKAIPSGSRLLVTKAVPFASLSWTTLVKVTTFVTGLRVKV